MVDWFFENILLIIPGAPLAACLWIIFIGQFVRRDYAHRPVVLALLISAIASILLMVNVVPSGFDSREQDHAVAHHDGASEHHGAQEIQALKGNGSQAKEQFVYQWISTGRADIRINLRADAMTTLMLVMVTCVSLLVAIFASGYMHGDPGYPRFFACIAAFVFSMCMLVLAGNFILMFVFWEGVGLCSYLLIGFWFQKPSAAAAAKKAFVVNRIGDFGFILGIFLIWTTFGSIEFDSVLCNPKQIQDILTANPQVITTICLLLFIGAIGKSAQFPLHVWLPDAMEGPTPVSALIHAATMVTAGVYLVARCTPLFVCSPTAQMVVAGVGATTALVAALTALTQYDLKRVLAYSTVSQLGYMFMSLGAAGADQHLAGHAVTFAMFHMFTHAFFKAVLFLSAGSVMHAMGDVIDMRRFGGLRHELPITHGTFLCGAMALAGVPLLSGFWSKDEIVSVLYSAATTGEHKLFYSVILGVSLLTALLTAFYTFRAYFMTFHGEEHFPEEAGHHPHDAPPAMAGPLGILALASLGIGILTGPTHLYGWYLQNTPNFPPTGHHGVNFLMMGVSIVLALAGIAAAWYCYVLVPAIPERLKVSLGPLWTMSSEGLYLDKLWLWSVVMPLRGVAAALELIDRMVLDRIVDGFGKLPVVFGRLIQIDQNGQVQNYAVVMILGLVLCILTAMRGLAGM